MASADEATSFVDRRESLLKSPLAKQISPNKSVIRESELITEGTDNRVFFAAGDHLQSLSKTERSEVSVEVQGLRETTLSTSETVVTNRVRTVYDRPLGSSSSSSDLDHKDLLAVAAASQDGEDTVFGETDFSGQLQRERKTSDSYYISQTYNVNTEERLSKSVTAVRSVSFRSSKDFALGDQEATLHFVDRLEEIIPGHSPEVVGSPKDNQVKFLWYHTEQQDMEALRRIQSARENVQQLIESTYMVSDIADVVDDNYMGPESKQLVSAAAEGAQLSQHYQTGYTTEDKKNLTKTETGEDTLNVGAQQKGVVVSSSETSQDIYRDTVSANDVLQLITKNSFSSNEVTWGSTTSNSFSTQRLDPTSQSLAKPVDFPEDLKATNSLTAARSSPPTLEYSPGMAIRSYAMEELAEKKFRVTPDRVQAEAKTLRFDKESSGVDLDKGSSVDGDSSLPELAKLHAVSDGSYFTEQIAGRGSSSSSTQSLSRQNDESLEKILGAESFLVGYRFHDVGVMQRSGGVCNLAFDDSDEGEVVSLSSAAEYRSSSVNSQIEASINVSQHSSQVTSGNSAQVSATQQVSSSVEYTSSSLPEQTYASISRDRHDLDSCALQTGTDIQPTFSTENFSQQATFKKTETQTGNISLPTEMEHARRPKGPELSQPLVGTAESSAVLSNEKGEHSTEQLDAPLRDLHVKETARGTEAGQKETARGTEAGQKETVRGTEAGQKETVRGTEAGQKGTTPKLAQSSAEVGLQYAGKGRETIHTREVEDSSSYKDAGTAHSITVGGYSPGYSASEERRVYENPVVDAFDASHGESVGSVESSAWFVESRQATCYTEAGKTSRVSAAGDTVTFLDIGTAVRQVIKDDVDNAVRAGKVDNAVKAGKVDNAVKAGKVDNAVKAGKVDNVVRAEKVDNVERAEKVDNFVRAEKVDNVVRAEKVDNVERAEKVDNVERAEKVESAEKVGSAEKADYPDTTGKAGKSGRKRKADKGGNKRKTENAGITAKVDNVHSKQTDNIGSAGKADNIGSAGKADNVGSAGKADNVGSAGKADNVGSAGKADNVGSAGKADNVGSAGKADNVGSAGKADNVGSSGKADNVGSKRRAGKVAGKRKGGKAVTTVRDEVVTTDAKAATKINTDTSVGTKQVASSAYAINESVSSYQETGTTSGANSASIRSVTGTATRTSTTASSSLSSEVSYTAEARTSATKEQVSLANTTDGQYQTQTSLARSEILSLLKEQTSAVSGTDTSAVSETERIERILQDLGPAELKVVQNELRVTGSSTTLKEYLREVRLEKSTGGGVKAQSSLTDINTRSEILSLLTESSTTSETERIDRILQALGPVELKVVQNELRVTGSSTTLKGYLREVRLENNVVGSVEPQSSLTDSDTRSEILQLLRSEPSLVSETERIERILHALGPAELKVVQNELRVSGSSTTLKEYLREVRFDVSKDRKVETQHILTDFNTRSEILQLLKSEPSLVSDTERIERILHALGPAELNVVQNELRVTGSSTTLKEYLREVRFEKNIGDRVETQSSLTDSDTRSEILSLLKSEPSLVSETEWIERILQALSPAELKIVANELRVSGSSTTLREYLRETRAVGSAEGKVKSVLSSEGTTNTDKVPSTKKDTVVKATYAASPVSVSRRFNISSKFEATLKSMGAVLKSESLSIAVYFDTADFDLTLSDCWLRSVNSEWQFHRNFTKLLNQQTKDQYVEVADKSSILQALAGVLEFQPPPTHEETPITMFIQKSGLREFVRYTTIRRSYELRGMRIELELPEYGFWVGTVTVDGVAPLQEAVRSIDSFWKASEKGAEEDVKTRIEKGAEEDVKTRIEKGAEEDVKTRIEKGAEEDVKTRIEKGAEEDVKTRIEKGAEEDVKTRIEKGAEEDVKTRIEKGAEEDVKTRIEKGAEEDVKTRIEKRAQRKM